MKIKVIKLNYKIMAATLTLILLLSTIFTFTNVKASEPEGVKVPIIMYHSVLKDRKNKYIVSPEQIENDFKYLKERGYETITMTNLIEHVYNNADLPEKPIIITFDDGYYNNYYYVLPLLEKYNMKAVISIVGEYTDRFTEKNEVSVDYGYFRWEDISKLVPEGTIEFQNHSYNLHMNTKGRKGAMKKRKESLEEYKKLLEDDILRLQKEFQNNCYYTPNTFAYPFGAISKESEEIIKEFGFQASFSCLEGMNYITSNKDCLYRLKRYNRSGKTTTEKFFNKILKQEK